MASNDSVGVPVKLLHDGEGHVVTVELKNGEVYRGLLSDVEDTMNCQLKEVTMTGRDGKVFRLENVFLRGGQIKFIILPELLKNAPILLKVQGLKAKKIESEKPAGRTGGLGTNAKKPRKA